MINIVFNENFVESVDPDVLEKTVYKVLEHQHQGEEVDISIAIEDDAVLKHLNLQFLGIDNPTDVLSFPSDEMDPDTGHLYLGDIIVSLPTALAQASAAGHPLIDELQLLVVHGVLHLLGYDHTTPELKSEMWCLQAQILQDLAVKINKLPEE